MSYGNSNCYGQKTPDINTYKPYIVLQYNYPNKEILQTAYENSKHIKNSFQILNEKNLHFYYCAGD